MIRAITGEAVHILGSEEGQLFDLLNDPDEINNLWNDPQHAAMREKLTRDVLERRMRSSVETMNVMESAR